jgi:hypothetical protein
VSSCEEDGVQRERERVSEGERERARARERERERKRDRERERERKKERERWGERERAREREGKRLAHRAFFLLLPAASPLLHCCPPPKLRHSLLARDCLQQRLHHREAHLMRFRVQGSRGPEFGL